MKKSVILFFIAVCILPATAQDAIFTAPDYKQIEKNVRDSTSPFYYPSLLERYLAADSTLNTEERRHVYFGYVYQPEYTPADTSQYNNLLAEVLSSQSLHPDDYPKILSYADALLVEDPFNLRALKAKLLVYAQQNNVADYKKAAHQKKIVQDAIVSTGDGMSEKTPFYVIRVSHEYDLLPFLGFSFGGDDKVIKNGNYLTLGSNRFGVERVYFDISPVMQYVNRHGGGKL
ncbi:DUF4919 domain-containing protein [Limibacterium fermenti]|uniref:DUF4919 domain-containing protein n=1 Tax=Limibacterium fermenti TaxID=3229863 RepID=UPI000E920CAA|nr:hypothetical protein [Porphyromonadaceae bacterium]HBX46582.1 hypothetical protein [Porphyromonadaceae bacterium]